MYRGQQCVMVIYLHRPPHSSSHSITVACIFLICNRALIDQLFSRESSASINLIGDRSVDPACDHLPVYRACHPCNQMLSSGMNQHPTTVLAQWPAAIWHSWQLCWLDDSAPTPLLTALQQQQQASSSTGHSLCGHTLPVWLALSQLFSVSVV